MLFITYNLQDQWSTPKPLGPKAFRHLASLLYRLIKRVWQPFPWAKAFRHFCILCQTNFQGVSDNLSLEAQGFSFLLLCRQTFKKCRQPSLSPKAFGIFLPFLSDKLHYNPFPWAPGFSAIRNAFFVMQKHLSLIWLLLLTASRIRCQKQIPWESRAFRHFLHLFLPNNH